MKTILPLTLAAIASGSEFIGSAVSLQESAFDSKRPFLDVRLGYGMAPTPDTYDVTVTDSAALGGASHALSDGVSSSSAQTLSFGFVGGSLNPTGLLFGGELVYGIGSQRLESRTLDGAVVALPADTSSYQYRTFGANALAGVGLSVTRNLHLEALGVLGAGALDLDFGNSQGTLQEDGGGHYWQAGVRGGAYYSWDSCFVGVLIEYTRMSISADAEWVDATSSISQSFSGIGGRLEFGVHIQ